MLRHMFGKFRTARVGQGLGDVPAESTRRQEWVRLAAEVDVFRDRYQVDPTETQAIPEVYRERSVGAKPAALAATLENMQS